MGADSATSEKQWVSFSNRINGLFVITVPDVSDISGYINFSRACLLAGSQGIIFLIEVQQTLGHGPNLKNRLWAGYFARTATDAFDFVNDRVSINSHINRVKAARGNTIAISQASYPAFTLSAIKSTNCATAVDTRVVKLVVCTISAQAGVQ